MRSFRIAFVLLGFALTAVAAPAAATAKEKGASTGLPIPRFVSLRATEVNLRAGPGLRYPIEWVFQRKNLPVEVLDEFKAWRQIRAWDGTLGWVHAVMLQGKRMGRVIGDGTALLRDEPSRGSAAVAMVQPGAIGRLEACEGGYCRLAFGSHTGWLGRERLYGAYDSETFD